MTSAGPQRARSAAAKKRRERAILDAAQSLGAERSVREVTLTDIAAALGMHKSAMLRYFETREQIFLALTAKAGGSGRRRTTTDSRPDRAADRNVLDHLTEPIAPRPMAPDAVRTP